MDKDITITLTQDEAAALFTATSAKIDGFREQMSEAGVKKDETRVLECAKWIETMKAAQIKLLNNGARFCCW